jgi:AraC family transcriptional regulator
MNVDFALSKLKRIGMGDRVMTGRARGMALHSMVTCCGWQRRPRGFHYDWDGLKRGKAEFALIQYTLRGWGMLDFEGVRKRVEPGTVMLLHFPHRSRYWLPEGSDEWEFVYACLNGRELLRIWRELIATLGPLVELGAKGRQASLLLEIYRKAMSGQLDNHFDNSAMAYSLAMSLAKFEPQSPDIARRQDVNRTLRLCQARFQDPSIDVDAMAQAAGLSRHHFSRVFEKAMGETPAAYLKSLRMKEAAKLLQTSQLSVKEVASACGFGDCSYFCQAFRKAFGLTAAGFRRSGMSGMR